MEFLRTRNTGAYMKQTVVLGIMLFISLLLEETQAQNNRLWCYEGETNPGPPLPDFPSIFSARIQVNFETSGFSSEIVRKVDTEKKRNYMEIKNGTRHDIYISLGEEDAFVEVHYTSEGPTCKSDLLSQIDQRSAIEANGNGLIGIFQAVEKRVYAKKDGFKDRSSRDFIRGIPTISWKLCEYFNDIGAAMSVIVYFADESWIPSYPKSWDDSDKQIKNDIVRIEAHAEGGALSEEESMIIIADYYDYQDLLLEDKDFQVPEDVDCPGYRGQMKSVIDSLSYFSYKSEMINYTTPTGSSPIVSHREVYYDFTYGLARVDYTEAQESKDSYSPLAAKVHTIIYDFNSGIQYSFEPLFGSCSIDTIQSSLDVFGATSSATAKMLDPPSFFYLNTKKTQQPISYKGLYETRGLPVDLFSRKTTTRGKDKNFFWYFTSDQTKLIEDNVEKNVLVKMVSRPETGPGSLGDEGTVEINFYNFVKEEPSGFVFDIAQCYNESSVKEYVITFPGKFHVFVEDALYLLKIRMQKAVQDVTGVSRHRVSIQQIYFRSPYLLVQFKLLDLPMVQGASPSTKENNLETAVQLLQDAVNKRTFSVEFRTSDNKNIILEPEPNGLKEFQGERQKSAEPVYHESSFVGMSIGMTVLGFLLGGIVVNLIITRKFGVSLLQRAGPHSGATNFSNPLNESSM